MQLPGTHVIRFGSRTGSVIALVDRSGERTMLADRAACTELADPDPSWLDDVHHLHVPYYSLVGEPIRSTTRQLAAWAAERGISVCVDTSSAALLHAGSGAEISALGPAVVVANELEAATIDLRGLAPTVIVKQGAGPALVGGIEVPAVAFRHVPDTTGAGDAFAAGLLIALGDGASTLDAVRHAHEVAARHLARLGAT
jgi:sugar/nucleoside kinase (ribokinase family)